MASFHPSRIAQDYKHLQQDAPGRGSWDGKWQSSRASSSNSVWEGVSLFPLSWLLLNTWLRVLLSTLPSRVLPCSPWSRKCIKRMSTGFLTFTPPATPASPEVLLTVDGNFVLPVSQAKSLEVILTSSFSYPPPSPATHTSCQKILLFLLWEKKTRENLVTTHNLCLFETGPAPIIFLLDYCRSLLTGVSASVPPSPEQSEGGGCGRVNLTTSSAAL